VLLLRHNAYPLTRPSHNRHLVLKRQSVSSDVLRQGCTTIQHCWTKCV